MADPTSDPLGTYAGIINDPLPSGEGPKKALDTLNTTTKEEIKAIAQAANEAEAKARAKANSLSMKIQSTMFRSIAQTDATLAHLNR